jgi:NAD+-dependent protein deacetylase SIR2
MVYDLSIQARNAQPTAFHLMLADLAQEGRLRRLFTQNIDGLDASIPSLATKVPLTHPYPITLQLHGSVRKMTCTTCYRIAELDPELFNSSQPLCAVCENIQPRAARVGKMRPRLTLYEEHGPDDDDIGDAIELVLQERYNMFIVAGTALAIPKVIEIVQNMRSCVDLMVWINKEPPRRIKGVKWDHIFLGSCDDVAKRLVDLKSQ